MNTMNYYTYIVILCMEGYKKWIKWIFAESIIFTLNPEMCIDKMELFQHHSSYPL